MLKSKNKIPKGYYCYSENGKCPYWKRISKYNAYCSYLKKSDKDISNDVINNHTIKGKQGEKEYILTKEEKKDLCPNWSLLWDQCKECGINIELEPDEI